MIDQEEIHSQCLSKDPKECIKAIEQLKDNFSLLPDKQQAWNDLVKLTTGENLSVLYWIISALHLFSFLPSKHLAWNKLIELINYKYWNVRKIAAFALGSVFSDVPDKQRAWNDLITLTNNEDRDVRHHAANALGSAFSHVPDKQQAWNDLHKLTNNEDRDVMHKAASAIGSAFSYVPDKQQAWNDLHKLTNDEDSNVRFWAAYALCSVFSDVPDKQQAWNDLHKLNTDKNSGVRFWATSAIGSAFSHVPDKQQAWNDLHKLTTDKNSSVRYKAAHALGSAFFDVPDKQQVWNDLIKLNNDKDIYVRYHAANAFGYILPHVPDRQQAWNNLIKLTNDENSGMRLWAASALGSVFSDVPDKQQAWNDLHKLITDKNNSVRSEAASAIGSAFSDMPNKQQAWNDLIKLTSDENSSVRTYANHSLGKVSIFKASQSEKEEEYKNELETAIVFFEKAAQESLYEWINPSQFCLPFYRSFYTIIFEKQETKEEVNKYLAEAKYAVGSSKSKELLLDAVNNLANALKEVQNLKNVDLETKKCELNFYRQYCDRAAELMRDSEKTVPFATIAMRKGLPYFDRKLKSLIEEIKEKAKTACQEAKGTPAEYAACAVNDFAKKLKIGSPEYLVVQIESLVFLLKSYIPKIEENNLILDRIDKILREEDVVIQYTLLNNLLPQIIDIRVSEKTAPILSEIKSLRVSVDRLIESVDELQNPQEYLDTIQRNLEEIKNDIPEMKGKIDEVLYELYSPLNTTQKLKVAIPIIPLLASYELETDVPRFVADRIDELKNLVLRFKKGK